MFELGLFTFIVLLVLFALYTNKTNWKSNTGGNATQEQKDTQEVKSTLLGIEWNPNSK
jgi:hypothetical protein